jgi:transcriptional regulator with XRE-family HTH domain
MDSGSIHMIDLVLRRMIDEKLTTVQELGDLTGVAPSTVYRWMAGQSEPDYKQLRMLLVHLPNVRAQELVLQALTAGTHWRAESEKVELDVNNDGRIDGFDALDVAIQSVQDSTDSLGRIRETCRSGKITREEVEKISDLLSRISRQSMTAEMILLNLLQQSTRKKLQSGEQGKA